MAARANVDTKQESNKAVRRSLWQRLERRLGRHQCNDLLSTRRVLDKLDLENRRNLGLQNVPLDHIVGSAGRFQEFDLSFKPLGHVARERWERVAQIVDQNRPTSPIMLYKVGDRYFVEDGNHRISVARSRGRDSVEALVVELDPSPLTAEPQCTRLGYKV